MSRPEYIVKQMIQTPSYFNDSGETNILNETKINVILQSMLKAAKMIILMIQHCRMLRYCILFMTMTELAMIKKLSKMIITY